MEIYSKNCIYCNELFYSDKYHIKQQKICRKLACKHKLNSDNAKLKKKYSSIGWNVIKLCVVCGKQIIFNKDKPFNTEVIRKFCSIECKNIISEKRKILQKTKSKKFRELNPRLVKEIRRNQYLKHQEKEKKYQRKYRVDHWNEKLKWYRINYQHRVKTDPYFKLKERIRCSILDAIQNNYKCTKTSELLGADIVTVKSFLEKQFQPGMTWDNHGGNHLTGWHIDHVIPISSFDLSKEEDQRKCFHYTNLQPLWGTENCSIQDTPKERKIPLNELMNEVNQQ